MDSLKYVVGVIAMVLCLGLICAVIWVLLFGIPRGAMEGGTLVQDMQPLRLGAREMAQKLGNLAERVCWKGGRL